jgi:hypothetical protein
LLSEHYRLVKGTGSYRRRHWDRLAHGCGVAAGAVGQTGLTAGLSRALASDRLLIHDHGRVLADLACAVADGAEVISDFRVMTDQAELFGLVASVPAAWRTQRPRIWPGAARRQAHLKMPCSGDGATTIGRIRRDDAAMC